MTDHLNTVRKVQTSSGTTIDDRDYTPFGMDLPAAKEALGEPAFTGHVEDKATGLTYMQARFYEPASGRFLAIDPVGFSVGQPQIEVTW